ncbi:poly-gamma-glutamate synthase PgsB [[Clostridium] aminophilum]|uniref:Poly-gamma-glutamate synthase PgsB/CapB n=1 Tax=[Clostridium] aminophilum TaxID=1526 RepID=A0A1I6KEX9_9FIRM|nr:poly-gamma-glutamate synthase PgsB [[Clostridium] aminophilum]SFR89791.1 poly-gamma-glutamate synthase PgsB/CapB [[Clostridium] aminophilum]
MLILLLLLTAAYLIGLLLENEFNRRALSSFRYVIHVNGIRGKTSTCRAIDAALRTHYRTFTKTTGTDAAYIGVDGTEHPVRRFGPANIHEQIRTIRKARREGAEILILECMAVRPDLQKIAQDRILQSKISVITNVRYDHTFEMGDTLPEIAESLSAVIPDHGILISADPHAEEYWGEKCRQRGTRLITCPSTDTAAENEGIALAVARTLGIPESDAWDGLSRTKQDFGIRRVYRLGEVSGRQLAFLNLFSANDPQSTESNLADELRGAAKGSPADELREVEKNSPAGELRAPAEVIFLYNHRPDRPDRAILFAKHFVLLHRDARWFISGKGGALAARLFREAGAENIRILGEKELTPEVLRNMIRTADPATDSERAAAPSAVSDDCRHPDANACSPADKMVPAARSECIPRILITGIGNIKGPAYHLIETLESGRT